MEILNVFYLSWNNACNCHPEYRYVSFITTLSVDNMIELIKKHADRRAEEGIEFDTKDFLNHCDEGIITHTEVCLEPSKWSGYEVDLDKMVEGRLRTKNLLYSPGKYQLMQELQAQKVKEEKAKKAKERREERKQTADRNKKMELSILAKLKKKYENE